MRITVRGDSTRVSHRGRGTQAFKTDTAKFFHLLSKSAAISKAPVYTDTMLPPGVRWVGPNLTLLELEPQYRDITYVPTMKYSARGATHHRFKLFMPRALFLIHLNISVHQWYIQGIRHFFLRKELTPSSVLYLPPLPNSYHDGNLCFGQSRVTTSFNHMINTAIELIYYSAFNHDLSHSYSWGSEHPLPVTKNGADWMSVFTTWQNATPSEVLKWTWRRWGTLSSDIVSLITRPSYPPRRSATRPLVYHFNMAALKLAPRTAKE